MINFNHTIENRTSNTWIGGYGTGGCTGLKGSIAEVYKFSRVINEAEQIIIANYLAAKYNISLSANDIYDEDRPGARNYDYDIAGIGRVDASNLYNDSQGTGIVGILNPTQLGDNEFLFWGHDNGAFSATETLDVPSTVEARLERVWRVSERNTDNTSVVNVGKTDIRFDLTGLGSVTASDLVLLVDTDNDFSDETPISGATSLGSNIYQFLAVPGGVLGLRNYRRFTLGTTDKLQTPLPIELLSFNALPNNDNYINLEWETASEINNNYFTIQKSLNTETWSSIADVNGVGNSTQTVSYSILDKTPYQGVSYYRIKQTDFDGAFSYSKVIKVSIDKGLQPNILVYPNPSLNYITIEYNEKSLGDFSIFNIVGQEVLEHVKLVSKNETKLKLDISKLKKGSYVFKCNSESIMFLKE